MARGYHDVWAGSWLRMWLASHEQCSHTRVMSDLGSEASLSPRCVHHRDAVAIALCSRCGDQLCQACLAPGTALCTTCFARDPTLSITPMPWEDASRPLFFRLVLTFWALLRPWSRADAFARGSVADAAGFALLTALPLAALAQVIPLTHTLLFAPSFSVSLIGQPSPVEVAFDVARAVICGVVLSPIAILPHAFALWLASGLRQGALWLRYVLYWAFLYPMFGVLLSLFQWAGALPLLWLGAIALTVGIIGLLATFFVARRARHTGIAVALFTTLVGTFGRFTGEWLAGLLASLVAPLPVPLP